MLTGKISLYLRTKGFLFKDQLAALKLTPFLSLTYLVWGFFLNPYRSCRRFFEKKGLNHLGIYGETPLQVYQQIAKELKREDHFVELGSGRGKGCFWIKKLANCKVTGIELHPGFFYGSLFLKKFFRFNKLTFIRQDFFQAEFSTATFVYLYGSSLKEEEIPILSQKIPQGVHVATVSFSFKEFDPKGWEVKKVLSIPFPWGMAQIYIQIKNL